MTTNFLNETESAIKEADHTVNEIIYIGNPETGHQCTWDEFKVLADFNYNSKFDGDHEVAVDLVIVFSNLDTLQRRVVCKTEWWEFTKSFKTPTTSKPITTLRITYLNQEETDND